MANLLRYPRRSRRRLIGSIAFLCVAFFLACSDDDSDFAVRPSNGSSSSVKEIATNSSSSCNDKSSSSSEYKRVPCNVEKDENCIKDDRDGQTYRTVKIGDQLWMAENLNYETPDSYCYNESAEYCEKYGRLYLWSAATTACTQGWHLPSKDEWNTLFNAVGDSSTAGTKLKSTSGWSSNGNGTDAFSFSALPAGYRYNNEIYDGKGDGTVFWSSTENGSSRTYGMNLRRDDGNAYLDYYSKYTAFSVRCIKDSQE